LFLYPKPTQNSDLFDRFDAICEKLQLAIDTEEDNDQKAIVTFLNYYSIVVDTNLDCAEQIKTKIITAIQNGIYDFLRNENISVISNIELQDLAVVYTQIQNIIDKVLRKENVVVYVPDNVIKEIESSQDFIIETGTAYSRELLSVPNNFDSIRSISVRHANGCAITNRGVKILESEEELFEYMKLFGNMHKAKLQVANDSLPQTLSSKVNIIDWACGQGIGSMLFFEKYGTAIVNNVTLIEPSEIAIKRAVLHLKKYGLQISQKTICKKLDDLETTDFTNETADITIHLFSNILDIDDYSQKHLIQLIESTLSGKNYFVCVSPYIDEIKTERLESFKRYFENKYYTFELLLEVTNSKNINDDFWCCNNTFRGNTCEDHPQNGCNDKWTRVIKVFDVI
jgi:hypothetical protein